MILTILFIYLGIVLVHGLCRAYREVGFEEGKKAVPEIKVFMFKDGFRMRFMADPLDRGRSQAAIDKIVDELAEEEERRPIVHGWGLFNNPFFGGWS